MRKRSELTTNMNTIPPGKKKPIQAFFYKAGRIGLSKNISYFKYSKGVAFNYMNLTGLLIAAARLIYIICLSADIFGTIDIIANVLPVLCCTLMMVLMYKRAFVTTVWVSFIVFPLVMLTINLLTGDRGVLFYLVPYLVYPFFFLNSRKKIILTFLLVAVTLTACLILEKFQVSPAKIAHLHYFPLDVLSFTGCLILMFISLYFIKFQVWQYQSRMLEQKKELEQRRLDIEIQKEKLAENNLVKDKLFSILSHDLKTSVYGIQLLLSKEKGAGRTKELLYEHLPTISAEVNSMADLFNNLINWSKLQLKEAEIRIEQIDIETLANKVKNTLNTNAVQKGVTIETDISDTMIYADKNIMEIILRNLVSNAIKFTRPNDTVVIKGQSFTDSYMLQVSDNGVGIGEEAMQKILANRFYTTTGTNSEKGTGLGLIICRDLIEKCSGSFNIISHADQGTVVSVSLPQFEE